VQQLGAASAGVWTRRDAVAVLGAGRVDALVRAGTWQVLWPGVLADAGHVPDPRQRAWAAVLASGGPGAAVACGRTAARLHGLPLVDDQDPATGSWDHLHDDVHADRHVGDVRCGGRVLHRRQLRLRPDDVVDVGGLRVTAVARTLSDLSALLAPEALTCAVDRALAVATVSPDELDRAVERRTGRRGGPRLGDAVRRADARAEAPSETLARLLLEPHFPLVPQVLLLDGAARPVARFDLADEQARVAVECDGRAGHQGTVLAARDRRRDRTARQLGWVVERFTWYDLRRRQGEVVDRVAELYAEQRRRRSA